MIIRLRPSLLISLIAVEIGLIAAAGRQSPPASDRFNVSDAMIPMRDGVRLHAKIFAPLNQSEPLPFIMLRTPYGVEDSAGSFTAYLKARAHEGYIFVFQDIRGKFGSEGTFVMQRPVRAPGDTSSIDEGPECPSYTRIEE